MNYATYDEYVYQLSDEERAEQEALREDAEIERWERERENC